MAHKLRIRNLIERAKLRKRRGAHAGFVRASDIELQDAGDI